MKADASYKGIEIILARAPFAKQIRARTKKRHHKLYAENFKNLLMMLSLKNDAYMQLIENYNKKKKGNRSPGFFSDLNAHFFVCWFMKKALYAETHQTFQHSIQTQV